MIRKIIKINEEKCSGCGACAHACHEGAIEMVGGKAKLTRESFCDGLGDCLPECPTGAITFEEREAPEYDEAAVLAAKEKAGGHSHGECHGHGHGFGHSHGSGHGRGDRHGHGDGHGHMGCPGAQMRQMKRECPQEGEKHSHAESQLGQWPCQIKLVPMNAPYFDGADLLIAADCTAYAYANFHMDYMRGRITLIGCPKLDSVDYSEKLTGIIQLNNIRSVTVLRMEVPCCGGLEAAARAAVRDSGKTVPLQVVTVSIDGHII